MAILEEPIKGIKEVKNYINGEWVDSKGKIVDVVNPATGKVMGKCPISTKEEINAAVDAAKAAFPDWRKTTPLARSRILFRFKALLMGRRSMNPGVKHGGGLRMWRCPAVFRH